MKCRFGIIEILCLLGYLSIALPIQAQGQTQFHLQGNIKDAKTNELLEFATVLLKNDSVQLHAISDTKGSFSIKNVPTGTYSLSISFIGYTPIHQSLSIHRDTTIAIALQPDNITLKDIIVTASESRGLTTSSKINRKAMELLQPSSFTDILALLPAEEERSCPRWCELSPFAEVVFQHDYDISSLGTSFLSTGSDQHGCQHATRAGSQSKRSRLLPEQHGQGG
ncbi:MAG: carboxypeptidase-like regulatory domain-containing protein [Butyricimonas faecihominis]